MSVPTDLSNLALWFKPDVQVYKDNGVTLAVDGDTVQLWKDQSGNTKDASQATSGSRPTYKTNIQNGLPIVRYSAKFFNIARAGFKTYTAFFVCKRAAGDVATTNRSLFADTVSGGNHEIYISRGSDSGGRVSTWDSTNTWKQGGVASDSKFEIYTYRRDDTAKLMDFWVGTHKQLAQQSFASAAPAVGTAAWQGQGTSGGEQFNGDLGEWFIFSDAKSDSDVLLMQQYLEGRWACSNAVLKVWLESDTQVYKDAGSTLAADTETVQQWNDQSGGGLNFSQATALGTLICVARPLNASSSVISRL